MDDCWALAAAAAVVVVVVLVVAVVAPFISGSGAGLGATDEEAVEADGGRDTRFVGDRARAGPGSEIRNKNVFVLSFFYYYSATLKCYAL